VDPGLRKKAGYVSSTLGPTGKVTGEARETPAPPREAEARDQAHELGQRIRDVRQKKKMTLRDAADAAGVSESFLSQVERGLANPSVASLRRIADAMREPSHRSSSAKRSRACSSGRGAAPSRASHGHA